MSSGRKRVVSSCIPCYTRKQKCNREYPCNHCSRRQCPEECAYYSANAAQALSSSTSLKQRRGEARSFRQRADGNAQFNPVVLSSSSLADLFGYCEESNSNTLALIRKLNLGQDENRIGNSPGLTPEAVEKVQSILECMPDRQILDFLMQYFVAEVNWMDQLVHIPWLLGKYQQWWLIEKVTLVLEVDLAVLILRICSYASQYLPSQGYTLNRIDGALLADIRNMCDETAGSLISISRSIDKRGSLIRVQSMAFYGLKCQMEGRRNAFWESLDLAIKVAKAIGLHSEAVRVGQGLDEIEKEMERRTFCNLYIWDSSLSRQLDRTALLSGRLDPGNWPQIYFESDNDSSQLAAVVPDPFTERLLQVRLADFWRFVRPARSEFDMVVAEEIYDQFCRDYMAKLPCTFSLDPDKTWDKRFTKLQLQRQLLHIAIYESLCWHFRPVLLHHDKSMPSYKRVLLGAHKRALAVAALHTLQGVTQLHAMLSGSHKRFAGLIFSTFDAAVLLVYLCTDPQFPPPCPGHKTCTICPKIDPLRPGMIALSRQECIQAVQSALNWLRMLGEEISAADIGANTLAQLLSSVCKTDTPTTTAVATNGTEMKDVLSNQDIVATTVQSDMPNWHSFNPLDLQLLENFLPMDTSSSLGDMTSWPSLDSSMFSL